MDGMEVLLLYCKMTSGWGGKSIILKLRGEDDKERMNRLKVVLLQGVHRKGGITNVCLYFAMTYS